jgi:hypothetical protein
MILEAYPDVYVHPTIQAFILQVKQAKQDYETRLRDISASLPVHISPHSVSYEKYGKI